MIAIIVVGVIAYFAYQKGVEDGEMSMRSKLAEERYQAEQEALGPEREKAHFERLQREGREERGES